GYGNGWYVDPAALPAGTDPLAVHVEWAPQRIVWAAIGVSVVGVLVCLALVFFARARKRRAAAVPDEAERPFDPVLRHLRLWRGAPPVADRLPARTAVVATVGLTLFALLLTPRVAWQLALLVPYALAVGWAMRSPRGRSVLGLAGAAFLAGAAGFIVLQQ